MADGLYPIVGGLQAKAVGPLAGKVVSLAATGDPKEIIKTIDAGLDAFLSVPPDRFVAAARALKTASAEATAATTCNLVCMPKLSTVEGVAGKMANALSVTDPAKLETFVYQVGPFRLKRCFCRLRVVRTSRPDSTGGTFDSRFHTGHPLAPVRRQAAAGDANQGRTQVRGEPRSGRSSHSDARLARAARGGGRAALAVRARVGVWIRRP